MNMELSKETKRQRWRGKKYSWVPHFFNLFELLTESAFKRVKMTKMKIIYINEVSLK